MGGSQNQAVEKEVWVPGELEKGHNCPKICLGMEKTIPAKEFLLVANSTTSVWALLKGLLQKKKKKKYSASIYSRSICVLTQAGRKNETIRDIHQG